MRSDTGMRILLAHMQQPMSGLHRRACLISPQPLPPTYSMHPPPPSRACFEGKQLRAQQAGFGLGGRGLDHLLQFADSSGLGLAASRGRWGGTWDELTGCEHRVWTLTRSTTSSQACQHTTLR